MEWFTICSSPFDLAGSPPVLFLFKREPLGISGRLLTCIVPALRVTVLACCMELYRVGQKSKLLILSEFVNKTEKIGGI